MDCREDDRQDQLLLLQKHFKENVEEHMKKLLRFLICKRERKYYLDLLHNYLFISGYHRYIFFLSVIITKIKFIINYVLHDHPSPDDIIRL